MSWYWAAWILLGFGVPEGIALFRHRPQDTLSDTMWRWFDIVPGRTIWQWSITQFLLIVALTWLLGHIGLGIWRVWRA